MIGAQYLKHSILGIAHLFYLPIDSIEDGLDENDWDNWVKLTEKIGDRMAKYNQLIRIEEELGDTAAYGYKRLK